MPEHKLKMVGISIIQLTCFQVNSKNFYNRLIIQDETRLYHFKTWIKIHRKKWKHSGSLTPKNLKRAAALGFCFFSEGIVIIDDLENGKKVINESEFKKLKEVIKSKRKVKLRGGVLLLKDSKPVHIAQISVSETANCIFEFLTHPPSWFLNSNLKSVVTIL